MLGITTSVLVGLLAALAIATGARIVLRSRSVGAKIIGDISSHRSVVRVFSFGTGAFLAVVCLDFLPDAWSGIGHAEVWVFLGAIALWLATHTSDWLFEWTQRSNQGQRSDEFNTVQTDALGESIVPMRLTRISAVVLAVALSFHTFLEGTAVGVQSGELSWQSVMFDVGLVVHKLPEGVLWGMSLLTVFPKETRRIRRVLWLPAGCTVIGVFAGIILSHIADSSVIGAATGIVAGAMMYIAFTELLPALRDMGTNHSQKGWFIAGLVVMAVLYGFGRVFGG